MLRDILGQAYGALKQNRRRSTLTMLGMAWGIATVVLLLAYGAGFQRALMVAFSTFGSDMIAVFPGRTSTEAGGVKAGTEVRLTLDDMDAITQDVPLIKRISPEVDKSTGITWNDRAATATTQGCYAAYFRIRNMDLGEGRYFNSEDENQRRRVVVIGYDLKKKLFSGQNAVGEQVRIDGMSFEVVGVLKHLIQNGDDDSNNTATIPFGTMGDLTDTRYLGSIMMNYEGPGNLQIVKSLRTLLAARHNFKPDDRRAVFVFDVREDLKELQVITVGIKVLLTFIGMLTLGIGGIGLMNIMLVSVTQRTREIGVEKALGARRRDILMQFLSEALAITFTGGILGVIIAYAISFSVGSLTLWSAFVENASEGDIHLRIDPGILLLATVILTLVGVVSGMFPAIKASRLQPVEALRYE
jgi:putative ABC transport system permease protein